MILDLSKITFETRDKHIFFATHEFIIYKDNFNIVMASCDGQEIASVPCPSDYRAFETADLGDAVLLILAGKNLVLFDKAGSSPIHYQIDPLKIGRVITKIFPTRDNNIIIGTRKGSYIQIVHYEFMSQKRIAQSTSWKASSVSDFIVDNGLVYALLDSSFLTACDAETCEVKWNRFESSLILPKLVPYKNGILYACQGALRSYDKDKGVETVNIPISSISGLVTMLNDENIVFISDQTNIGTFSLKENKLLWEVVGSQKILDGIVVKGKSGKEEFDILAIRIADYLSLINLTIGKPSYYGACKNIYKLHNSNDHIIINRKNNVTDLLPGIENV